MRLLYPREKERRNSFRKVSVLTGDRMSDSFLQRFHTMPFILRPDPTIAADLIDAPVNFHRVVVRIAKLYGDLATGPAAALKIDLNLIRTQAITSADNFGECRNFKGEVMQLFVRRLALAGADQGQAMMVRVAAQKNHPARHHCFRVNIGNLEAQHLGVKSGGFFQVADLQDYMTELADVKIHPWRRSHAL